MEGDLDQLSADAPPDIQGQALAGSAWASRTGEADLMVIRLDGFEGHAPPRPGDEPR